MLDGIVPLLGKAFAAAIRRDGHLFSARGPVRIDSGFAL